MNLKRSLYTMVGLGLVGSSLLAAISLWGDAQQERALADMQEKASWLRLQLTSDMMHDAMRGDVLEALRIAKNPLATATEKDALLADADEHASNFISNMNELQQAKLPDAVKQKSDEVALALIQYRNSTNDIIATALKQPTRAETLWPAFMQQFRQLETSMAEFSDVLEQSIKSSQTQVVKDNQQLTGIFYSTVALIIFVLLICAQIIIRRVFKTLGGEPEVASRIVRQISQGEFNVQIPEVPSQSLLDQMRQMTTSLASFVQAQQHLAQQHVAGVRSARLDCAGLSGGFAHMAEQVNLLIEGKERLLDEVLAHIRCYVQGDFAQPMRALPQELMAVTQAVNSTRQGLATAAKSFIENARIRVALDSVDTNVLVVDPDRQIIYCNPAFVSMLSNHASLLGRELTGLNTQQPIGQSLHVFQPQTGPRLALFNDITQAHQANLSIGGLHFVLSSNPILSATGEHLGLVIEFVDRTPMVQIENEVARVLAAAAKGDFSQQISLTAKEGFFLNLSNSINQLQAGVTHSLAELAAALAALAKGDLTRSMQGQFDGAFAQIQTSCNGTVASLTRLLRIIADAALQIRSSSNEIAVGNQNLSQRTEEQATSLEETASAMDELTSAVKHNNDHAQQASQLAQHASEMAQQGGLVVNSVVTTMRDIQHSSHKIVEIISVIDGIAFQTNILALNAAVEAARAGEQGRGFAVVAAEVRSLAQRSAAAAKEIATLIEISVDKVESGTRQVDAAGKTMGNIIQSVSQVTEIIIGISSASHEQTTGIQQVSQTIAQMDNMTQQNAALVEQAAAASEHLREQAETMAQIVGQFILDDD